MHEIVEEFAEALKVIDDSRAPFKNFQPGVGPYWEPQVTRKSLIYLIDEYPKKYKGAKTKRTPDVLIPNRWALEFKIVRPFGDNGKEAEHWSQNLLHPYAGNVSSIGDVMSLMKLDIKERKGIVVFTYEHNPPIIDLSLMIDCFEHLAIQVLGLPLGSRQVAVLESLIHPIHQQAKVYGWEVFSD